MLYAVIGYPMEKTLSPCMHNAAFKYYGINSQYIPMPIKQKDMRPVIRNLHRFGFKGINITVPYKERIIEHLDSISNVALDVRAVNTVVIKNDRLHGENTDVHGFYRSVLHYHIRIKDKKVLLIGAGGAGRAVGSVLSRLNPAVLMITDISSRRSRKFSRLYNADHFDLGKIRILKGRCDIVVNAVPYDHQRLAENVLGGRGLYYDVNYIYPLRRKGSMRNVNGLEMLVQQGARSFEIWTGRKAPLAVMRKAVKTNV